MTTDTPVEEAPSQEEAGHEEIKQHREDQEKIEPNKANRTWTIGQGEFEMKFTQKPLSYFGKMEFFSLLGESIDKMMAGDEGLTVTGMLSQFGQRGGTLSMGDLRDADVFVKAIAKLMVYAPDLLEESYCIWLNVARGDRTFVKSVMRQPEEEGGLSDDDGLMVIQTFIDQNLDAMESFFTERVPKLVKRIQSLSKTMSPATESA
jgi:hypothetical protein